MEVTFDLGTMWAKTQAMLRDSIDALVNMDVPQASEVCRRDDEVDRMKHQFRIEIEERIAGSQTASGPIFVFWRSPAIWSGSPIWPRTSPKTSSIWSRGESFATASRFDAGGGSRGLPRAWLSWL